MSRRIQFSSVDFDAELANITASGNATSSQLQGVRQRLDALRAAIASTSELASILSAEPVGQQEAGTQTLASGAGAVTETRSSLISDSRSGSTRAVAADLSSQLHVDTMTSLAALDRTLSRSEALQRSVQRIRQELAEQTVVADRLYASEARRTLAETEAAGATARARTVDDILARWVQLDDAGFLSASISASTPTIAASSLAAAATPPSGHTGLRAWRTEHSLTRDQTSYLRLRGPSTSSSSASSASGSIPPISIRVARPESSNISNQNRRGSRPAPTILDFNNQRRSVAQSSMAQRTPSSSSSSSSLGYFPSIYDHESPETTRALVARARRNGSGAIGSGLSSSGAGDETAVAPNAPLPLPRRRRRTASSSAAAAATMALDSDVYIGGTTSARLGEASGPLEDALLRSRLFQSAQAASDANGHIQALRDRYMYQFQGDSQTSSRAPSNAPMPMPMPMPATAMELPLSSEELDNWLNSAPSARHNRRTRTSQASQTRPSAASDSSWRTRMEFLTSTVNLPLSDSGSQATTRPVSPDRPAPPPTVFLHRDPIEIMALPQSIEETLDTVSADEAQQTNVSKRHLEEGALYW